MNARRKGLPGPVSRVIKRSFSENDAPRMHPYLKLCDDRKGGACFYNLKMHSLLLNN